MTGERRSPFPAPKRREFADAGFSVAEHARAAECGADDVVAVLDGTESAYTFRCVVRRRPIYEPEIGRLPDAASGAAHFVEQNVECFVDSDSPNERAAMIERVQAALAEVI